MPACSRWSHSPGPARLGLVLYTEQFLAVVVALSLALVFLTRPSRARPLDWALGAAGPGCGLWIAGHYPRLVTEQMNLPAEGLLLAGLVLVLEGLRRTTGWMLVVVVLAIRMMIQSGYRRRQAAAIEAVASTGGQIVPPVMGAVTFLMADILQRPYADIVIDKLGPTIVRPESDQS